MSKNFALIAPSAIHQRHLEKSIQSLQNEQVTCQIFDTPDVTETQDADLIVMWAPEEMMKSYIRAQNTEVCAKTIAIGESAMSSAMDAGFFIQISTPVRLGALMDHIRRYFNRAIALSYPDGLSMGTYTLKVQEMVFVRQDTEKQTLLTEKERDILFFLYEAGFEGLTRQDLLDKVWAYASDVETHTLETHIYRLRQKIEEDPATPQIIINSDGVYKLGTF